MIKTRIILFVIAFLTWVVLSWSLDAEHVAVGILVGLLVSFTTSGIFTRGPRSLKKGIRYLWFFYYIPVFIWECIKANIDGAYRVAHPQVPMRPGIVKIKTSLRTEAGLTLLANSITLKPGTMTVDIDKERGFLYVHWVDVKTQDVEKASEYIAQKFERILKRIFE